MVLDELQPGDSGRAERFYGCATDLPIATDSLDVVLLPHVLEFADDPHQVLREIDRVLMPEGHVVIFGFNPYSMWGLRRMLTGWRKQPPWCGHFFSQYRIRDWLALLGFEAVQSRHYFFRPPVQHHATMEHLQFVEGLGHYWPVLGGAYLVVARKRVTTLTPIRPRWKPKGRLVPGSVAEPSLREID
jgi:SAM-dependent methyltransferase